MVLAIACLYLAPPGEERLLPGASQVSSNALGSGSTGQESAIPGSHSP